MLVRCFSLIQHTIFEFDYYFRLLKHMINTLGVIIILVFVVTCVVQPMLVCSLVMYVQV
jgi:hypothetical protein